MSHTVWPIGPGESCDVATGSTPAWLTRPTVGFNATTPSITVKEPGVYSVAVTSVAGCVFHDSVDVTGPAKQHVSVYPAPSVDGNFTVSVSLPEAGDVSVGIYDLNGKFIRDVELPGIGSAGGFGGKQNDTETFYSYSSFNAPPTIYHYDMKTGESKLYRQAKVKFNPDEYEVKEVFYPSKDGTKVTFNLDIQIACPSTTPPAAG